MANITGTSGNDSLVGTSVADTISGLDGHDTLVGNAGNDSLNGGLGNDYYVVGAGDVLTDAGGVDTIETAITWHLAAGFENLIATGTAATSHGGNNLNNQITGNAGANWIAGREGDDTLAGGGGNDTFNMSNGAGASYGNDVIDGGDGVDTIDFGAAARTAIVVDLSVATVSGGGTGGAGSVWVTRVENVNGSAFDDQIIGNAAANFLYGFNGNDTLDGGAGNDRLEGAAGNDQYVFSAAGTANADTVVGFASGSDRIVLASFDLGSNGNFAAGDARFAAGAGFNSGRDASDRIVYNSSTGQLWYDADGSGAGAAQLIATLQGAPALMASDISVQDSTSGSGINGTAGDDSLTGTPGNDTINGFGGNDTINGSGGSDVLSGGSGNDLISGGDEYGETPDTYFGGDGDDTLDGAAWAYGGSAPDTMDGGLGNDLYYVDHSDDVLSDAGGTDSVYVFDRDWTLGAGFENLHINNDYSEGPATGIGNELDNVMSLGWAGGRLEGRGGDDTLTSGTRESTLLGGDGNDVLSANGYDTIDGGAGDDTLSGGYVTTGGAGNDRFSMGSGSITDFASGSDRLVFDGEGFARSGPTGQFAAGDERFYAAAGAAAAHDATDRVIYNTTSGELYYDADGTGSGAAQLITVLEGAPSLAAADIEVINGNVSGSTIDGTPGNDSLAGTPDDDTINGLGGNDTLDGLAGDDVLRGGAGNDSLVGVSGYDTLIGEGGNDTLEGVRDTVLDGGLGDDTYLLPIAFDPADINDAGGTDTVIAPGFTLGAGLEILLLRSVNEGTAFGTGNELANLIRNERDVEGYLDGGDGDDTLTGGAANDRFSFVAGTGDIGNDQVDGGAGFDFIFAGEYSAVVIDFRSGTITGGGTGGSGSVSFVSIEGAYGGAFDDLLVADDAGRRLGGGTGGNDTLLGGAGNDSFYVTATFGSGFDSIDGGAGIDTLDLDVSGNPGAVVDLGAGTMTLGSSSGATLSGVENVNGTRYGSDRITGSDQANLLRGGWGNDTLDGRAGNDTLVGGDAEFAAFGADTFVFSAAPGTANADTVAGFERFDDRLVLDGTTHAASGPSGTFAATDARFYAAAGASAGHDADDRVVYNTATGQLWYDADGSGSGASQLIATLQGAPELLATNITIINGSATPPPPATGQTINGTAGNDTLAGGAGNDTINGLAGADRLSGLGGNDSLLGSTGHDTMLGGDGNDWLQGGGWSDNLTGGAGADSFVYAEAGTNNRDTVTDFVSGTDELLFENGTLTGMGAAGAWAAGDARFWAAAGATSGHDGDDRLVYNTTTGNLYYDADGSGAGAAQVVATFTGAPGIVATDITVI